MKRKAIAVIMSAALLAAAAVGCGKGNDTSVTNGAAAADEAAETQDGTDEAAAADGSAEADAGQEDADTEQGADAAGESDAEQAASADDGQASESVEVRIGSLKGPTSIGLVYLMDQAEKGEASGNYTFQMEASADELLPQVLSEDLDIVLVPANVASVLYNKTQGGVSVIDINTLGVLYVVTADSSIRSMADLKGRTVYLTGKGTTPDYVLQYLLKENGLSADDVTLEYKSEATEVAAILAETPDAVGVLPQPFVTAACAQNEDLSVALDLTEEWAAVQGEGGSSLVTGVTVVSNSFLETHPDAVDLFLEEHRASTEYANEHVEETAELVAAAGIIEKAEVAAKAMPACNITYIDGADMRTALEGYLQVLCEQDAASVGGGLPGGDFYYQR